MWSDCQDSLCLGSFPTCQSDFWWIVQTLGRAVVASLLHYKYHTVFYIYILAYSPKKGWKYIVIGLMWILITSTMRQLICVLFVNDRLCICLLQELMEKSCVAFYQIFLKGGIFD